MAYETAATATATGHAEHRSGSGENPVPSPEGIGDIVLAGHPAPYPHLQTRSAPTIGRLAAAARAAASALGRP
ncbi:hypothetical protein ACFQZU_23275, partial [Streptomonospora algeriensis]